MKDFFIVLLLAAMFLAVFGSVVQRVKDDREQNCVQAGGVPVSASGIRIICFAPGVTIEYR